MDIAQIGIYFIEVVGAATLIFRGLDKLAQLTKSEKDDIFVKKALNFLVKVSEVVAWNKKK